MQKETYTFGEYENLKQKYGNVASWVLWNNDDETDPSIIEENINLLNSRYVGLNISKPVTTWSNFRGGKHGRKIKRAFINTAIKGFYLTDFFKNIVEKDSSLIEQAIKKNEIDIEVHVEFFIEEMKNVKVNDETVFLTFGNLTYNLFDTYLKKYYPNNKVILLKHYSARGTDEEWVQSTLEKIGL